MNSLVGFPIGLHGRIGLSNALHGLSTTFGIVAGGSASKTGRVRTPDFRWMKENEVWER